jgi:hypothetical protein
MRPLTVLISATFLFLPCHDSARGADWKLEKIATLEGFEAPESCAVHPLDPSIVYVSNIAPKKDDQGEILYWADDEDGYITRLKDQKIDQMKWKTQVDDLPLSGPKGLSCSKGSLGEEGKVEIVALFGCDNQRLFGYALGSKGLDEEEAKQLESASHYHEIEEAKQLNDIHVVFGEVIYLSDTEKGCIWKHQGKGDLDFKAIRAPEGINGVTATDDGLFCVSWTLHDLYELDPAGEEAPKPFGLADHFKTLDTIEVLEDGSFLVTDFEGNKICLVGPDRESVVTLAEMVTPADVGFDRTNGLLYVPSVTADIVNIYRLEKSE